MKFVSDGGYCKRNRAGCLNNLNNFHIFLFTPPGNKSKRVKLFDRDFIFRRDERNWRHKMASVSSKKKRKDEIIEEDDSDESSSGEEESDDSESDVDPGLVRKKNRDFLVYFTRYLTYFML